MVGLADAINVQIRLIDDEGIVGGRDRHKTCRLIINLSIPIKWPATRRWVAIVFKIGRL